MVTNAVWPYGVLLPADAAYLHVAAAGVVVVPDLEDPGADAGSSKDGSVGDFPAQLRRVATGNGHR